MSTHSHGHESSARSSNRVKELVAILERQGIATEDELDRVVETFLLKATPANGARLVARAWCDPDFKRRLLDDGNAAIAELGIDMSHWAPVKVRAVDNRSQEHNVIVCTLCSCYPIALLGPSPHWYKSEGYRSRVVVDPRGVLTEFGLSLGDDVHINVWDSTAELRYLVVPLRPPNTEDLTVEQLAKLVTRNGLIGTAAV